MNGKQLEYQYKNFISDYHHWDQFVHADDYVLYKKNIGEYLSLDETCLSQGEVYTILTDQVKNQVGISN